MNTLRITTNAMLIHAIRSSFVDRCSAASTPAANGANASPAL